MPSIDHEALVELFRQQPRLAVHLLTAVLGLTLPEFSRIDLDSGDLTQTVPAEYHADAFVTLRDATDAPVLGIVVEIQKARDPTKQWSWPAYVVSLRNRLRCPVALMVVCRENRIARWSATPIEIGPGFAMTPLVLGPDQVPTVTAAADAAANLELAVLSAIVHSGEEAGLAVLDAVAAAVTSDSQRGALYADLMLAVLPGWPDTIWSC